MPRWHSCNVLQADADRRQVWQFDARNGTFPLNREETARRGEPLSAKLVGKSWSSLVQRKLNVAWLPPEQVFFRVAQLPESSLDETRAMVELQLEKFSPIPVAQALWTMHVLPNSGATTEVAAAAGETGTKNVRMQTVVVTIVARSVVEEFLGQLEDEGFLADRLELPLLDQLQTLTVREDGAWIYPDAQSGNKALVAWWYGGVLQTLDLLVITEGPNRAESLRDELRQMAWAGELSGWLTSPPLWHVVTDPVNGAQWERWLREGVDQPVEIISPVPQPELAALTARRATQTDTGAGLLPQEFAARYQQRFYGRLWMRGLLALLVLYGLVLVAYFAALGVLNFKTTRIETTADSMGPAYTNALQLKARAQILHDRQDLKFAGLECWMAVAELMPSSMTLDSLRFSDGKRLSLAGTSTDAGDVIDFGDKLRKAKKRDKDELLFDATGADVPRTHQVGNSVQWTYELNLKRSEEP